MKKRLLPLIIIALLSACSSYNAKYQVPVPKDQAKSYQLKLQAAQHWDLLANDIAKQSLAALTDKKLEATPISIGEQKSQSSFSKALNEFVVTRLVNQGAIVKKVPDNKLVMEYDIQVLRFDDNRSNRYEQSYIPGQYTALASNLVVTYDAVTRWKDVNKRAWSYGAGIGWAMVLDMLQYSARNDDSTIEIPNVEVIVNSSLVKDGNYIMRRSDVYYVSEPDAALYQGIEKMPSKTLKVVNRCGDKECSQ